MLRREFKVSNHPLRVKLGDELFECLLRVVDLFRAVETHNSPFARARLASLKAWLGPDHWTVLLSVIERGTLASGRRGDHGPIRRARTAVCLVFDWEKECAAWGLE